MAGFRITKFGGMRPVRSALKLPDGEAQVATNARLGSGDLKPWVDVDSGTAVKNVFSNRTIHKYDNDGDPIWLEWNRFVDVAPGSVKGDDLERIYYTGDGVPKMTYRTIAASGSGPYPATYRRLGIPAPTVAPNVSGTALPETVESGNRRAIAGTIKTNKLEIVHVDFVEYPGTGTANELWNPTAAGQIAFDLQPGDTVKVTEVINANKVRLGSATDTGAFAVTAANDDSSTDFLLAMSNDGNNQTFTGKGWRLPDGVEATITGHLLRVGDVIKVTRVDHTAGLILQAVTADDFHESGWNSPAQVTIDGSTFYQVSNATVTASADGTTDFTALLGGFYYDVERASSDSDILEDRSYVYTWVSALGEEGPPSKASAVISTLDGDTVSISGMQSPPTVFRDITHINIYRTNSTQAGTEFQFVKQIDVSSSASENVKASDLGEVIGTTTWSPPPADMAGIISMPNGMMVGFEGKNVHMCEPYFPHAWPPEYDQAIDYEIVGAAAIGNSVALLTEGVPYILSGSHPRNTNIRPYKLNQACVNKESIASTEDRIIYASPDGLVEISVNGAKLITGDWLDKKEWAAYSPATIVGELHDGKYFGFWDGPDSVTPPPTSAGMTGTVLTDDVDLLETDIVAGAKTILLTLTSDTWVAAGATFNAERQAIINGFTSNDDFVTGFDKAARINIPVGDVVRTSSTLVTITLSARAEYSITTAERISCTIPGSALTAGDDITPAETFVINPLQDYSSKAIGFSAFDNGGTDLAYAVASELDIIDWDSYAGVGKLNTNEITPTDATYAASLDRWVVVSNNGSGASQQPSTANVCTSDDDGVSFIARAHRYTNVSSKVHSAICWHPTHNTFVIGGENLLLQTSPDGFTWSLPSVDASVPATADIVAVMMADLDSPYVYAAVSGADFLLQSPDLSAAPPTNTWAAIAISYPAATGSKHAASGDGVILSVGSGVTNLEVARTVHGAASGASIGTINTFNCVGVIYANDQWVFISDNFRTVTCAGGDDSDTIGNYSAISSEHVAAITVSGIKYDEGDGITQGYGYVVHGVADGSSKGVIYTSPDLSTWTLRHTHTQSVAITALATKYPETQLASTLLSFSPTLNGAQAPTIVGDSFADYISSDNTRTATAQCETDMYLEKVTGDCTIKIVGRQSGVDSDNGSTTAQAQTTIFNLGAEPDKVRITVTDETFTGGSTGASKDLIYNEYVDGAFEDRVINQLYGVQADCRNSQAPFPSEPLETIGSSQLTVQFTFRKEGYNDYSISYKIRARATSSTPL